MNYSTAFADATVLRATELVNPDVEDPDAAAHFAGGYRTRAGDDDYHPIGPMSTTT
jgi:hypothetical protein